MVLGCDLMFFSSVANAAITFSDVNQPFVKTGLEFLKRILLHTRKFLYDIHCFPIASITKQSKAKKAKPNQMQRVSFLT